MATYGSVCRSIKKRDRAGAAMILMLALLIAILGMVAFAVDAGLMVLSHAEAQNAVDSAALAAALELQEDPQNVSAAESAARNFVQLNRVGVTELVPEDMIDVERGVFDKLSNTFTATNSKPNAVRVFARQENQPFFFARIFGCDTFAIPASAVASSSPRPLDIVMVLDLTSSMSNEGRIEALHNAAPSFVNVVQQFQGEDHIGVMGITANPDTYDPAALGHSGIPYNSGLHPTSDYSVAVLEAVLTDNFSYLKDSILNTGNLVAGKYGGGTGIGAGIGDAAHYLTYGPEARAEAEKAIVLMTDGEANRPSADAAGYARTMASYAASLDITVYTISLGNGADVILNQDIADITDGIHFDATGSGEETLTARLNESFGRAAAAIKRAKLVK
jgi:Flp pilus assembly protein TadG